MTRLLTTQVQAAVYILKTPCLWDKAPQVSTEPSPFPPNATYIARALAYVYAADQCALVLQRQR